MVGNRGLGIRMKTIVTPVRFGPLISDNASLLTTTPSKNGLHLFQPSPICLFLLHLQQKPINAIRLIRRLLEKHHVLIIQGQEWVVDEIIRCRSVQSMPLRHCGTRNNKGVKLLMHPHPHLCSLQQFVVCKQSMHVSPLSKLDNQQSSTHDLRRLNFLDNTHYSSSNGPISSPFSPLSLSNHPRLKFWNHNSLLQAQMIFIAFESV